MSTIAFLFPGQGSQSVGMLDALAAESDLVAATCAEASEVLGYDLGALIAAGPEDRLNQTEVTQPAMLTAGVATWRAWRALGGAEPAVVAGHSLGEYTALVAAGAIDFADAVGAVAERARLMQGATPAGTGAMAAILGLEDAALAALCEEEAGDEVVSCANFNSPGQVVIAGHAAAVQRVSARALEAGARRALPLPVSVPSHCALMQPAAEAMAQVLARVELRPPRIPVVHNADVAEHTDPEGIREVLVRQLWQPVRWTQTIEALAARGVDRFVECGPGRVLAGLNRRIDKGLAVTALTDRAAMETLLGD